MLGIEQNTDRKCITVAVSQNLLCWKGAQLQGLCLEVMCTTGHKRCTASHNRLAPVSEYEMGKDVGSQLALQGISIQYATTDGDARSAQQVEDDIQALVPLWEVQRLTDPVHLSQH